MTSTSITDADRALKDRHRAMWASGNYPRVAADLIAELGTVVVDAAGVRAGRSVLDVAAGCGNAALPAAATGAEVVACDLTPELLADGARRAAERGLSVEWVEADAEALPFPDCRFDVVLSVVGAMFAPHHQQTADEIVRVCRPGGTITLANWTPTGFVGGLFTTMRPYVPPPPPGTLPAPLWGDPAHVQALLGDRVRDLRCERHVVAYPAIFPRAEDLREYYKAHYGPTIAAYRALAGDPERAAALDRDLADYFARTDERTPGAPSGVWNAEYLLVRASRN
jgi:SAM-dependent methyltransferase